jgi:hypothetical protein|tara:strand:+ start:766 stop:879 length:114 start_codon:yes stop_codon:yes gene_type:complete
MKKIILFFKNIYKKIKMELYFKKKIKELKKRDPFIYK